MCLPQETYQKLRYPSSPELTAGDYYDRQSAQLGGVLKSDKQIDVTGSFSVKPAISVKQQMLHRTRQLFIRQQTSVINAVRAHMAEFGIIAPVPQRVEQLLDVVAHASDQRLPELARACVAALGAQLCRLRNRF